MNGKVYYGHDRDFTARGTKVRHRTEKNPFPQPSCQKSSDTSIEFEGLDKLCVMWKCVSYVESGNYQYPDFQRYWDYWPLEKVKEKLPSIIAKAYEQDLWPKIQRLKIA